MRCEIAIPDAPSVPINTAPGPLFDRMAQAVNDLPFKILRHGHPSWRVSADIRFRLETEYLEWCNSMQQLPRPLKYFRGLRIVVVP